MTDKITYDIKYNRYHDPIDIFTKVESYCQVKLHLGALMYDMEKTLSIQQLDYVIDHLKNIRNYKEHQEHMEKFLRKK
jgi:hypothetical protein